MGRTFNLPFGICAFAYFNPTDVEDLPHAFTRINEPAFSHRKTGELSGGMQLHVEAVPPGAIVTDTDSHMVYFIGSARQLPLIIVQPVSSGNKITPSSWNLTNGMNAKVPLQR